MKRMLNNKRILASGGLLVLTFLVLGLIFISIGRDTGEKTPGEEEVYRSFSASDRETADLYAEFYETSVEEVVRLQIKTGDWEQTGKALEKEFFTISENKKYQMSQEGYSIEDLDEAEKLSAQTGRKAMELILAKGKASENKKWSEVVSDSEILSAEEQLGLSKEQIQKLKKSALKKEDRIEVAVLLLNGTYTFDEVMKELDSGKTVEKLKEQKTG